MISADARTPFENAAILLTFYEQCQRRLAGWQSREENDVLTDLHKERRAFMRMIVDAPVTLIRGSERYQAICRDLSANGMAIDASEGHYALGELIQISLATHSNLLPPFQAEARIVRADPVDSGYLLGIEFVSVG